jgi:DNA-directed RNA polymerase subunit beta
VIDNKVTNDVVYLSAMEEAKHTIAQANAELTGDMSFGEEIVSSRRSGDFLMAPRDTITLMDVSPKQLVSVAASLIPFLENDDANRALMGSNMQRQAVPLLQADAPLVGTGMEETVARDSGAAIAARRAGVVDQVDASRIVIRATGEVDAGKSGVDIYTLMKFQRSNQNTCINQRPLVKVGETVEQGEIIADGPSTQFGELALGRNVLVAFMPWNGYNYEDSILISERIVKDDVFTSIHIEEFEVMARDTKLGPEDITRDIPNVGEEALRNLDEAGIVYIGAEVEPGDILCGKITPKGESPMTPEEKLLRAIFGEKASDVRDTSLRLPPGVAGTVVEVRVFNRHGIDIDDRTRAIQTEEKERLKKDADDERGILNRATFGRLKGMLVGQVATAAPKSIKKGSTLDDDMIEATERHDWWKIAVKDDARQSDLEALKGQYDAAVDVIMSKYNDRVEKLERGDELPPGVLKMVKVFVAVKRKLQPGDKMAGRHGNKGVISRILPNEDMPFLEDGTPVDIVLNPLGVPSRMNVGQIFETHLGWAARGLGQQIGAMLEDMHIRGKDLAGKDVQRHACQAEGHLRGQLHPRHRRPRRRGGDRAGAEPRRRGADGHAGVRRRARSRRLGDARDGGARHVGPGHSVRRAHRRQLRPQGHRGLHLHAQAAPSGRRQDPRAFDRAVQPRHPAAAGRQGAVRRPALRRNGGVGAASLRRRLHAAGNADREVGRRDRPDQGL